MVLGPGLILNGELYGGAHSNAGEIGMILALVPGDGPDVEPLEHYASMAALCKLLELDPSEPELFGMVTDALIAAVRRWRMDRQRRPATAPDGTGAGIDLRSTNDHPVWRGPTRT